MVEYPTPSTGNVTGPIHSSLSPAEIAGPYSLLAHGLQKTGAALDEVASSYADQAGVQAVTTDAQGNIQVEHAPIIGPAAEHYARAVKFAALAEGEGAARRKDIELREQFHDNPKGYLEAAAAFNKKMEEQYTKAAGPLVGVALRKALEPMTTQTYRGLQNEKERLDLQRSEGSMNSGIDQSFNALSAMSRGGVSSGPEWDLARDKFTSLIQEKVNNPRLAYTQEMANNDIAKYDSELKIQAAAHHFVDEVYPDQSVDEKGNPKGGYAVAVKQAESIRTDTSLNMTLPQREAAYHRIVAELNGKAREDDRVFKGVNDQIDAVSNLATKGYKLSNADMGKLEAAVDTTGDPVLRSKLQQAKVVADTLSDWRLLPPGQLEQAVNAVDRSMRGGGPVGAAGLVSQAETGDPTLGPRALGNISRDSAGTKSYGFTGLNSGSGSLAEFVREHGRTFGLQAPIASAEFDAQWRTAATGQTSEFRAAQQKYFQEHNVASVRGSLTSLGIPEETAKDPRVVAYFADRNVQMGNLGLRNATSAWEHAHGDVPTFLRNMTSIDATPENLASNFRTAIATGVYGPAGHATRLRTRLGGALAAGEEGVPGAAPQGATPAGLALVDAGTKLLKEERTQLGKDPLGWSDRTGVMAVPPIQFGSPNAPAQMTDRVTRAESVAQHYGIAPTYLKPEEKEALTAAVKGGPEMIQVVQGIAQGFGSRAPAVMKELSKDAPTLAHIGGLGISGGSSGFMMDAAEGYRIRNDPELKKTLPPPNPTTTGAQNARMRSTYGQAFALMPDFGRAAQVTAADAFLTRTGRQGYDPTLGQGKAPPGAAEGGASERAFDRALQESAGATFVGDAQYGGVGLYTGSRGVKASRLIYGEPQMVMVPHTVRADSFGKVIGAISDEELRSAGLGGQYTAKDVQGAVPIAMPDGRYRFANGDVSSTDPKYVTNAQGRPFELNFGQMEDRLRKRVPEAFLGENNARSQ